jgi:hypothetical protein
MVKAIDNTFGILLSFDKIGRKGDSQLFSACFGFDTSQKAACPLSTPEKQKAARRSAPSAAALLIGHGLSTLSSFSEKALTEITPSALRCQENG